MLRGEWYPGEDVENLVSALVDNSIHTCLKKGWDVVLDNTHCTAKTLRETIDKFGKSARIVLKVIGSELTIKNIKQRNASRDKKVPEEVIDRMYKGFSHIVKNKKEFQDQINLLSGEAVSPMLSFKQDESLCSAIIVDIDGTIAHMNGKRGPFEWHKVGLDDADQSVLHIVRSLAMIDNIIFMSGRDESCRQETIEWLQRYYGPGEVTLYMRGEGDQRKDSIVKKELFYKHIANKYYVRAVLDDRDQVVRMWREELGLKCLQVAYGNF